MSQSHPHTDYTSRFAIDPVAQNDHGFAGMACIVADVTERRRAERALRETEEHFRMLVEGVRDYAIVMTDPEGRVVSWNTGAERILGFAGPEILGHELGIVFTPEDRTRGVPEAEMRTAAAEGRAIDERWHLRRDGSRFWASGVLAPLRESTRSAASKRRAISSRKACTCHRAGAAPLAA